MSLNIIKNVLIPEHINQYYLIPTRVLGFDITKNAIHVAQLYYNGKSITIEKFIHQPIDQDTAKPYNIRVSNAIKDVLKQVDAFDTIRTSISSSLAVIKKLSMPFTDPEKILKVLPYELEPFLPFSLHQAVADFITIEADKERNKSTILAAAVKKEVIAEQLNYFSQANVNPEIITLDIFDLYGLYKYIPEYANSEESVVLIDLGFTSTRIAYILNGTLNNTRTLAKGISSWAKELAQDMDISTKESLEKIIRFGFAANSDHVYSTAIKKVIKPFINELQFTLQSFASTAQTDKKPRLIVTGNGSEISNITQLLQESLDMPAVVLHLDSLLTIPTVKLQRGNHIPPENISALSSALITPTMSHFNLEQEELKAENLSQFKAQIITAGVLLILIFGVLFLHGYLQKSKLSNEVRTSERQIITALKDANLTASNSLTEAIRESNEAVQEQESIWYAFSKQTRYSFLEILEKISSAIDRKSIGLKLDKFTIVQKERDGGHVLQIAGSVKNFDALNILERELRESNLFIYVPSFQTKIFSEELPLKKNGEEV